MNKTTLGARASILATAALSACTGGSDSLTVSFYYDDPFPTFAVWQSAMDAPHISGLEGHDPRCGLSQGRLPAGMSVNRLNCNIEGTPTEAGSFPVTVSLSAVNADGSVTTDITVTVMPPLLTYPMDAWWTWGQPLRFAPTLQGYTPQAGDVVTYSWGDEQYNSAYPDPKSYLSQDPTTGVITGTQTAGPFENGGYGFITVHATIVRAGQAVTTDGSFDVQENNGPQVTYPVQAHEPADTPFQIAPTTPPFAALGFTIIYDQRLSESCFHGGAPVVIDPATGVLSGTISLDTNECSYNISWTATNGTQTFRGSSSTMIVAE